MFSLAIMTFLISSILLCREISLLPDGTLHMHVLDVGQGDAIFFVTPSGKQILVDGGPDLSVLEHLGTFLPFFDRTIDLLVLTHADADHITAFPDIAERYHIEHILLNGSTQSSGRYDRLLAVLKESGTKVMLTDPTKDVDLGDGVTLDIVWPSLRNLSEFHSGNDLSVVLRVLYNGHSILLTGDIEERAEAAILRSGADVRADVLKVPHHGSKTSSSTRFLLAVDPEIAIISVGRNNRFGHPHPDVTDRYRAFGIRTKTTADVGVVSSQFR